MKNTVKARVEKTLEMIKEKEHFEWEGYQRHLNAYNEGRKVVTEASLEIWHRDWAEAFAIKQVLEAILENDELIIDLHCKR